MVETYEEKEKMEALKHKNRLELLGVQDFNLAAEHARKIRRLEQMLEIANAGGAVKDKEDDENGV